MKKSTSKKIKALNGTMYVKQFGQSITINNDNRQILVMISNEETLDLDLSRTDAKEKFVSFMLREFMTTEQYKDDSRMVGTDKARSTFISKYANPLFRIYKEEYHARKNEPVKPAPAAPASKPAPTPKAMTTKTAPAKKAKKRIVKKAVKIDARSIAKSNAANILIKRFIKLVGRKNEVATLSNLYRDIERAIVQKDVRSGTRHAQLIVKIRNVLSETITHAQANGAGYVQLDLENKPFLDSLIAISKNQAEPIERLTKEFIAMEGKKPQPIRAKRLADKMGKSTANSGHLQRMRNSLNTFAAGRSKTVKLEPQALNGYKPTAAEQLLADTKYINNLKMERTRYSGKTDIVSKQRHKRLTERIKEAEADISKAKKKAQKIKNSPSPGLEGFDESILDEMIDLYERAQLNKTGKGKVDMGIVPPDQCEKIKSETGVDLSGFKRIFTYNDARHIYLQHGKRIERYRNQKTIEAEDIVLLPFIWNSFDHVEFDSVKTTVSGNSVIKYTKKIGKIHIAIEEIWNDKKELHLKSFYIKNAPRDKSLRGVLEKCFSMSDKSLSYTQRPKRANPIAKVTQKTKPANKSLGNMDIFTPVASATAPANAIKLTGDIGKFLGDIERVKCAITLHGDAGSGKSQLVFDMANAFASANLDVAFFSLEMGKDNRTILYYRDKYLTPENQGKILIADTAPNGLDTVKQAAGIYDVIIIDSFGKVTPDNSELDKLRNAYPTTIFVIIFQSTTDGQIRGGSKAIFDAPVNIETVCVDDTFVNNYAICTKNRYGQTGFKYNISKRKIEN